MKPNHLLCILLCGFSCLAQSSKAQTTGNKLSLKDTIYWQNNSGSVAKLTEERMNKGLVTNPLQALNGKAAGVNVTSSGTNHMAMLSSVRVRGTTSIIGGNDPLVIIDGVSSDLATLSNIYPADIESFTILKNASETALYGSRGASGVIEVKTKIGHGGQFHISYDGNIGFETVYKNLQMLRREGYTSTAQRMGVYFNDGGYDTDFPHAITRTGFVQSHHVAFSGGSEQSNYRASIGFIDHNTVVRTNEYENMVAKIDLSQKAFDDILKVDLGAFVSSQINHNIFDLQKLFYSAATQNPTFPFDINANGSYKKNGGASQITPPDALLNQKDDERSYNFSTHMTMKTDLARLVGLKGSPLALQLFGSYTFNSTENAKYTPTWVGDNGKAYRGEHKNEKWLVNAMLSWEKDWNIHHVDVKLLTEYQRDKKTGFWTEVKGFTSNAFGYDNIGAGSTLPWGGTGSEYDQPWLASVMGSASYRFSDYAKLTFTTRGDASSMMNKRNRWGWFPSLSGEWNVLKTFPNLEKLYISSLKLRMGEGVSGNLGSISSYNSLLLLRQIGLVMVNGSPTVSMGLLRNNNPDLKWERRSTFNVGTDMSFFGNRFVLTAEYYSSKTHDMLYLYDVPVPPFAYDKMLANLGSMTNSGFEIGFGISPIQQKDMELNLNVNISWQKNKLVSLSGNYNGSDMTASDITSIGGLYGAGLHGGNNNIVYQIVGQPLGVFYLPHCTGLSKNADGSYVYEIEDLDHNGVVNIEDGSDRYIAGQATPKMTLGSNISFRYKAFDISLQMNGAFGHKIYNGTALSYMNMYSFPDYNVMRDAPEMNIKDQTATDYWLEKGDFLNFDYLTIGWNVPLKTKKYIRSLRLSCSVNNLATITSYSGITPMINSYAVDSTLGIDDKRSYPAYRTFSFALSVSF